MISNSHARQSEPDIIFHDGKSYIQQNLTYHVQKNGSQSATQKALIDHGANGGFAGNDMLQLLVPDTQKVYVVRIRQLKCTDLPVYTCVGKIMTTNSPIIGILHQYA